MFRKFSGAMTLDHLGHDFFLRETPCAVACRALLARKEFFDCVVIQ
jgi:hypothetical protein